METRGNRIDCLRLNDGYDLRTYGMRVHYTTTMPGHIAWAAGDELLFRDKQFTMGDFGGFVHGLVSAAKGIIKNDLLFCDQLGKEIMPGVP